MRGFANWASVGVPSEPWMTSSPQANGFLDNNGAGIWPPTIKAFPKQPNVYAPSKSEAESSMWESTGAMAVSATQANGFL